MTDAGQAVLAAAQRGRETYESAARERAEAERARLEAMYAKRENEKSILKKFWDEWVRDVLPHLVETVSAEGERALELGQEGAAACDRAGLHVRHVSRAEWWLKW